MSQISSLIKTLKDEMKYNGIKYRDVAIALDMNETSVRRLFSTESLSLQRLENICNLIGLEISDLVFSMEANRKNINQLNIEQETELANDPKLLLVAHLVINGWSFEDIQQHYTFPLPTLIGFLTKLDKMEMIELLPLNRIRLQINEGFCWRPHGPVMEFFHRKLEKDFFDSEFKGNNEALLVMTGVLSHDSTMQLKQQLHELETRFQEIIRLERKLPVEKRQHIGIVAAIRPMTFSVYDEIRKK